MNQEQIRIRELESAVEANRTLLALESEKVRRVHHQLVCIGQELGGEQFDQLLKGYLENDFPPEKLAAEIVGSIKAVLGNLRSNPDDQQITNLNREIVESRLQLDVQTKRAVTAEAQAAEFKNQAASIEKRLGEAYQQIRDLEAALLASRAPAKSDDHLPWFDQ